MSRGSSRWVMVEDWVDEQGRIAFRRVNGWVVPYRKRRVWVSSRRDPNAIVNTNDAGLVTSPPVQGADAAPTWEGTVPPLCRDCEQRPARSKRGGLCDACRKRRQRA